MRKPNKGVWSKQEDQKLLHYITTHGEVSWRLLPQAAGLNRGNFGEDEEDLIIKLHALLGNRWSLIAGRLPGRTDEEVKNYWDSYLQKKVSDNNGVVESSGSRNQTSQPPDVCSSSRVEDDACGLMDLNLDLTLTINPSQPLEEDVEQNVYSKPKEFESESECECESSPTLLLFR